MPTTLYNLIDGLVAAAFATWCTVRLARSPRRAAASPAFGLLALAAVAWSIFNLVFFSRGEGHALVVSDAMQGTFEASAAACAGWCGIGSVRERRFVLAALCFVPAAAGAFFVGARIFLWIFFTLNPIPSLWGPGH